MLERVINFLFMDIKDLFKRKEVVSSHRDFYNALNDARKSLEKIRASQREYRLAHPDNMIVPDELEELGYYS